MTMVKPSTSEEFQGVLRTFIHANMGLMDNRTLGMMIQLGTQACGVCWTPRDLLPHDNPLTCCPKCHWGWACKKHREQLHHPPEVCATYKAHNRANIAAREHEKANPIDPLRFCPMGDAPRGTKLPTSWKDYWGLRLCPTSAPELRDNYQRHLSLPMTVLLGLTHHYSRQQLRRLARLELHVLGASEYEFRAGEVWEEIMHWLPALKGMNISFIGPDLRTVLGNIPNDPLDCGTCPPCTRLGRSRTYHYSGDTYHKFACTPKYHTPNLALACNTGVCEMDQETWAPTVALLAERGTPTVFTSYTRGEAEADQAWLVSQGVAITQAAEANPFGSTLPEVDVLSGPNHFFSLSACWMAFKGRAQQQQQQEVLLLPAPPPK